jgi:hypothetical protein
MTTNTSTSLRSLLLVLSLFAGSVFAAPTSVWNQGDPSDEEQFALEQINEARKDLVAYATRFYGQNNADPVVTGYVLNRWGNLPSFQQSQIQVTLANLQAYYDREKAASVSFPNSGAISLEPWAFYPAFQQRAAFWNTATTMNPVVSNPSKPLPTFIYPVPTMQGGDTFNGAVAGFVNSVPFTGPNATGGTANFGPFGATSYRTFCANLYAPEVGAREWVMERLQDRQLIARGEALPAFRLGNTRMAGIKIRPGDQNNRIATLFHASSEFFTQSDLPFGAANTVFITGVVYQDKNANARYDIGEGIGGSTVMPDKGNWYAVSSASGGFAIPAQANSGVYKLSITTGRLAGQNAEVTVAGDSVKSDWVLAADPGVLPAQVKVGNSTGTTQLTGLSTRGLVEAGANALFGGFVITGGNGARKRVLIRGVGPTLRFSFNIGEAIPETTLEVFDSKGAKIASNTGWRTNADSGTAVAAAAVSVGDFPLVSIGDSALVLELPAGGYTAVVRPPDTLNTFYANNYIGLLEVYDLTPSVGGKFISLATRGRVSQGIRQMSVGLVVTGAGTKRVLLRGVGSELATSFGLTNALPNPELTLYAEGGAVLAKNDDWSNSEQTTQIRELASASGAFALTEGNPDSSLLRLLTAGNYTAAVTGKVGTLNNGVAIVELYETP